jgi:hypothetical protein
LRNVPKGNGKMAFTTGWYGVSQFGFIIRATSIYMVMIFLTARYPKISVIWPFMTS